MSRTARARIFLGALILGVFVFAGYYDKPSDTEDTTNTQATLSDAQADAVVAAVSRK